MVVFKAFLHFSLGLWDQTAHNSPPPVGTGARGLLGPGCAGEVEDHGDRGSRRTPRLVQHIFYSAVKMAASEGARSGRTTAKRF